MGFNRIPWAWVGTGLVLVAMIVAVSAAIRIRQSAPPPTPAAVSTKSDRLVSLDQAIRSVRKFTGNPSLALRGGLETSEVGGRLNSVYYLETTVGPLGQDEFKVDGRTGEVLDATFRSRMLPSVPPMGLSQEQAALVAARFASERFRQFDSLRLLERASREPEPEKVEHAFKWVRVDADTGAELPVSVALSVSAARGEVFRYLAQRDPVEVSTRPRISREDAVALTDLRVQGDPRWDSREPLHVRLQVIYNDDNEQQLVWGIVYRGRQDLGSQPAANLRLLVDATTGRLVPMPS